MSDRHYCRECGKDTKPGPERVKFFNHNGRWLYFCTKACFAKWNRK